MTEHASTTPHYVCFFRGGRPGIGWLEGRRGKRNAVRLSDGSTIRISPDAGHYSWPGEPTDGSPEAALAQLAARELELDAQRPLLDTVYHSMTPGAPLSFEELHHQALAGNREPWARGLLFWALLADAMRFQYLPEPKPAFQARERAEIERLTAQEAERRERVEWLENVKIWLAQLETGEWRPAAPDDADPFLGQLRSMLALEKESPHWARLAKPLGLHGLAPPDRAVRLKSWLKTAGVWPDWPAIWLERAGVEAVFDARCLEAAREMASTPARLGDRTDFRERPTYTIDNAATEDFDDAISILEQSAREMTVAVHIAEPPELLLPGHPLFDEAERRMATAYTLEGIFPMFPENLANGRFSLKSGQEREVVTHVFRIGEGWAELERIERGLVRVRENLDFVRAQRLIEDHPNSWGRLALLCAGLRDARAENGALIQARRELAVDVSDPADIRVAEITRSGPAHQIVEELAVLANWKAAEMMTAAGQPAIFRVQESTEPEGNHPARDPARDYFPPASFTTAAAPHYGLGCPAYMQITSPIRRFPDLVMQRQLIGHAGHGVFGGHGGPGVFGDHGGHGVFGGHGGHGVFGGHGGHGGSVFPDEELLESWCARADRKMAGYQQAARAIQHDYLRRYLQQNPGLELKGTVRRRHPPDTGKIWLDRLELMARCDLPPGLGNGDPVSVRVESVDRDRQTVWVTCLASSSKKTPGP
ncbi:MAG: ribonuclease catalytic domain-containing protein [bacterium]